MSHYNYWGNKMPLCPWCDKELSELPYSGVSDQDGAREEITCEHCNKKYEVETLVEYKFHTKAVGCAKHKLRKYMEFPEKNGRNHITQYECTLCHNEFYDWQLSGGKYPKLKAEQYEIT